MIKNSTAQTMMGLERELKDAAASLQRCNPTAISLKAGCELFLRWAGGLPACLDHVFCQLAARQNAFFVCSFV